MGMGMGMGMGLLPLEVRDRWCGDGLLWGVSLSVLSGTLDDGIGIGNGWRYRGITTSQQNTTLLLLLLLLLLLAIVPVGRDIWRSVRLHLSLGA
jgi:hypothetical protein